MPYSAAMSDPPFELDPEAAAWKGGTVGAAAALPRGALLGGAAALAGALAGGPELTAGSP